MNFHDLDMKTALTLAGMVIGGLNVFLTLRITAAISASELRTRDWVEEHFVRDEICESRSSAVPCQHGLVEVRK